MKIILEFDKKYKEAEIIAEIGKHLNFKSMEIIEEDVIKKVKNRLARAKRKLLNM